jgi:ferric-dicitrate binding protein FerR (iron transport regulator)
MDSDFTSATLKEGSISISTGTKGEYLLTPGQALEYDRVADKVFISQVAVDEAFSWKDGKLCFRSESIHSIARKIERHYGCKVYLTTSRYDGDSLTAKFIHGETLDELMSALCLLIPGMKYTIDDSIVYIK